jgi:hypothetical protein
VSWWSKDPSGHRSWRLAFAALILAATFAGCNRESSGSSAATSISSTSSTVPAATTTTSEPYVPTDSRFDLRKAPVPSVCGHRAGTLVDGYLPGIPEGEGSTRFVDEVPTLITDMDGDGTPEAFAYISCNRGGVGWPETLGVWGPGPRLLSFASLDHLSDAGTDLGEYYTDRYGGLAIASDGDGRVRTTWITGRDGDFGCCATYPMDVWFTYSHGKLRFDRYEAHDETATLRALIDALNTNVAHQLGALDVRSRRVRSLIADAARNGRRPYSTSTVCAGGANPGDNPPDVQGIVDHAPPEFARGCVFNDAASRPSYVYFDLDHDRASNDWKWIIVSVDFPD